MDRSLKSANGVLPRHIAIIMDGNGRWAERRHLPRIAGHRAGTESVKSAVQTCAEKGVAALTLFAFSSENWTRPAREVTQLMELFLSALQKEIEELHRNRVRLAFIGERRAFSDKLQQQMRAAEELTSANTGLRLTIAANYGGQWDIVQAAQQLALRVEQGTLRTDQIDRALFESCLCLSALPAVDLFIRTGGEQRISNFLLWQIAYTELYFTGTLWPDFGASALQEALDAYAARQRRFGGLAAARQAQG
ncbi:MAG: di-trans,poly-cis-decaprenylcistransferase [Gammaproteobacteria bacterium]|nr:MAG: di-trans,poly-cis-decaprenylcistransferase [Gammaproteobacteria bacterium]